MKVFKATIRQIDGKFRERVYTQAFETEDQARLHYEQIVEEKNRLADEQPHPARKHWKFVSVNEI